MNIISNSISIISITIIFLFVACGNKSTTPVFSIPSEVVVSTFENPNILMHVVDPSKGKLAFYLNDATGKNYGNHKNLKEALAKSNKELRFAVNGGMYLKDRTPQGFYIENGKIIKPVEKKSEGYGNFFLQPNGIFYLDNKSTPYIIPTTKLQSTDHVQFATQSGPMLVIDGKIHPKFNDGSPNVHIRNGVGVLPNGHLLFAMSKEKINFYSFAKFFQKNGCQNALYLDGFVSRTYLPEQEWIQEDGNFGVIIGEIVF